MSSELIIFKSWQNFDPFPVLTSVRYMYLGPKPKTYERSCTRGYVGLEIGTKTGAAHTRAFPVYAAAARVCLHETVQS